MKNLNTSLKKELLKFKLTISPKVENKIRTICSKIYQVEWSGILFYSITGELSDPSTEIVAEDLILMHKGTSGFTEFKIDEEVIHYMAMEGITDMKMALIHSHNNMSSYFSGTDESTLELLGSKQAHFLSLIVNNAGQYVARITRKEDVIETIKSKSWIKRFISKPTFGKINTTEESQEEEKDNEETKTKTTVYYYELDIDKSQTDVELEDRIKEISETSVNHTGANYGRYVPPTSSYGGLFGDRDYLKNPINDLGKTKDREELRKAAINVLYSTLNAFSYVNTTKASLSYSLSRLGKLSDLPINVHTDSQEKDDLYEMWLKDFNKAMFGKPSYLEESDILEEIKELVFELSVTDGNFGIKEDYIYLVQEFLETITYE